MYTFESRIRYSETGADLLLTPEALVDYFQDCSTFQSEDLGVGLDYLGKKNLAWLVNFWQLDVLRYPALGEEVRTGTSPYRIRGFLGNRNFLMETLEGETLVLANSVWSLMDMERMVPVRAPQDMLDKYTLYEPFAMTYEDRKIALPEGEGVFRPARQEPAARQRGGKQQVQRETGPQGQTPPAAVLSGHRFAHLLSPADRDDKKL